MKERRKDQYGIELRQSGEVHAEHWGVRRIASVELEGSRAERAEKRDPGTNEIVVRLLREPTQSLKWLAKRLNMDTWTHASKCLVRNENKMKSVKSYDRLLFDSF